MNDEATRQAALEEAISLCESMQTTAFDEAHRCRASGLVDLAERCEVQGQAIQAVGSEIRYVLIERKGTVR